MVRHLPVMPLAILRGRRQNVKKVSDDFDGAKNYLTSNGGQLKKWVFIHNDPDGLTAAVVAAIDALRRANPKVTIEHWGFDAIWEQVQKLPTEKLQELFGPGPSEAMLQHIGFAAIQPVSNMFTQSMYP